MSLWQDRFSRGRKLLLIIVGMILFIGGPGSRCCLAHPSNIAAALAKVQPDGAFELRLRFDLLAYTLNELPNSISDEPMNALLDGPPAELESRLAEAKERFRQSFRVGSSGPEVVQTLTFPGAAEVLRSVKDIRLRLPVMGSVTVTGHLPPGTKTIAFQFDETLGTVVLTTEFPYQEPISEPVDAGVFSEEQQIPTPEAVAQAAAQLQRPLDTKEKTSSPSPGMVQTPRPISKRSAPLPTRTKRVPPAEAVPTKQFVEEVLAVPLSVVPAPQPAVPPVLQATKQELAIAAVKPRPPASIPSPVMTPAPKPVSAALSPTPKPNRQEKPPSSQSLTHIAQYIKMGYKHILPEGIDHILFILGLFLLSTRMKNLLQQVTAFTIAHSLTLALSLYGVIRLPSSFVEPVIAASIAFVAVENIFTAEINKWRIAVVFGFGLIHGLGLATALQGLGLRHENLLTALFGFNVGVELGQLTVVAVAFLIVGRFRNHPNYRKFVVLPGSLVIAVTAMFWMFQRIL